MVAVFKKLPLRETCQAKSAAPASTTLALAAMAQTLRSSSLMVALAVAVVPREGLLSANCTVSAPSLRVSPTMSTLTVLNCSPGAKVKVVGARAT